jgi:hypothetical protein
MHVIFAIGSPKVVTIEIGISTGCESKVQVGHKPQSLISGVSQTALLGQKSSVMGKFWEPIPKFAHNMSCAFIHTHRGTNYRQSSRTSRRGARYFVSF